MILKCKLRYIESHPRINKSFYAEVLESTPRWLLVQGISENDINHRGTFYVSLKDKKPKGKVLDVHENQIELTQVAVGDSVFIVYDGDKFETSPGAIYSAILIQIVE